MRRALEQARFVPNVARFIMPPPAGTAKNWAAYRARFVEPMRIRAGVAFWRANEKWLALAEELYGVPPEIVVGIVGVETIYGQQMGNFRVIDALATLPSTSRPAARTAARSSATSSRTVRAVPQRRHRPARLKGSYAGAIGMPQFMPSSFNRYAVDFDGDGHVDLHGSPADVIGSVAHYLAEFGWKRGLPTRFEVEPPTDAADRAALLAPDIVPSFSAAEMQARGAALPPEARERRQQLALVELQNGGAAPSYVAGTTNFYAVTRYNWSSYYALAVIELGEAVRAARGRPLLRPRARTSRRATATRRRPRRRSEQASIQPCSGRSPGRPSRTSRPRAAPSSNRTSPARLAPGGRPTRGSAIGCSDSGAARAAGHGRAPVAKAASLVVRDRLAPSRRRSLRRTPAGRALQRGTARSSPSGITLTSTPMRCPPPPRITPRSGTTSAKSAPQASVM